MQEEPYISFANLIHFKSFNQNRDISWKVIIGQRTEKSPPFLKSIERNKLRCSHQFKPWYNYVIICKKKKKNLLNYPKFQSIVVQLATLTKSVTNLKCGAGECGGAVDGGICQCSFQCCRIYLLYIQYLHIHTYVVTHEFLFDLTCDLKKKQTYLFINHLRSKKLLLFINGNQDLVHLSAVGAIFFMATQMLRQRT